MLYLSTWALTEIEDLTEETPEVLTDPKCMEQFVTNAEKIARFLSDQPAANLSTAAAVLTGQLQTDPKEEVLTDLLLSPGMKNNLQF